MSNKTECNILICGSQRFTERSFVFKVLTTFFQRMQIDNIIISKTSGACEFAQDWVDTMNTMMNESGLPKIGIRYFDYDPVLEEHACSVYEGNIPDFVLQNDKFFQDGVKEILKHNIQAIVAIPNPEGKLGASTKNIQRFCELSGKKDYFFDCSNLKHVLNEYHKSIETPTEELENVQLSPATTEKTEENAFGSLKKVKPR